MLLNIVGPSHGNPVDKNQSKRIKNRFDLRLVIALKNTQLIILVFPQRTQKIYSCFFAYPNTALEAVSRLMSAVKVGMGGRDPGLC